MVSAVV